MHAGEIAVPPNILLRVHELVHAGTSDFFLAAASASGWLHRELRAVWRRYCRFAVLLSWRHNERIKRRPTASIGFRAHLAAISAPAGVSRGGAAAAPPAPPLAAPPHGSGAGGGAAMQRRDAQRAVIATGAAAASAPAFRAAAASVAASAAAAAPPIQFEDDNFLESVNWDAMDDADWVRDNRDVNSSVILPMDDVDGSNDDDDAEGGDDFYGDDSDNTGAAAVNGSSSGGGWGWGAAASAAVQSGAAAVGRSMTEFMSAVRAMAPLGGASGALDRRVIFVRCINF